MMRLEFTVLRVKEKARVRNIERKDYISFTD